MSRDGPRLPLSLRERAGVRGNGLHAPPNMRIYFSALSATPFTDES
jgi:hypothetical protein